MPVVVTAVRQSCGSPTVARSLSTRPFLERMLFTSSQLPQSWGGCSVCLCFRQVIWAPSRSAIAMDTATEPIAMTMPSPKLTPVLAQGTAAPCTSWILGCWHWWAGPSTCEVKWSSVCDLILQIITWPVNTYYYPIILHCDCIIITSSLHHYNYYILYYYTVITSYYYYYILIITY